jgi:hypothetical protein
LSSFVLLGLFGVGIQAQAPPATPEFAVGKNVNAIGPAKVSDATFDWFDFGDIDRKQQNEPSVAISPTNSNVRCIGMNDYGGVDRPEVGEPWIGLSCTEDGGFTWRKVLHPRFTGDTRYPPLPYQSAADPVLKAVPGALLYFFINFDRGTGGSGLLAMSIWAERTTESGFPYCFSGTSVVDLGTAGPNGAGKFFDKEAAAVQLLPGTRSLTVSDCAGGTRQVQVPNAEIWVAYAKFTGSDPASNSTEILLRSSTDYGASWSNQKKVSNSISVNQGAAIALNGKDIVVVWRRFGDNNELPGVVYSYSKNGGKQFANPVALWEGGCFFDQGTTSRSFRTTAHPAITFDGSRYVVAWSARTEIDQSGRVVPAARASAACNPLQNTDGQYIGGAGRIVVSTSPTGQGGWSAPAVADPGGVEGDPLRGHQFMPFLATSGFRTTLAYSDTRHDRAWRSGDAFLDDHTYVDSTNVTRVKRHTGDVYATQSFIGAGQPFGPARRVTRFTFGRDPSSGAYRQLNFNFLNNRHASQGRVPFNGDYNQGAVVEWVLRSGSYVSSVGQEGAPEIVQLGWTDNRDMRGNLSRNLTEEEPIGWAPGTAISEPDPPFPTRPVCDPNRPLTGTRDQQIYTATLFPDLYMTSASASNKGLGSLDERPYSIFVRNTTNENRQYSLTILNQPPDGGSASFQRLPASLLTSIEFEIPLRSSIARTVYLRSTLDKPVVGIAAREVGGAAEATLFLNEDALAPPLVDPEGDDPDNPSVTVEEVHNLGIDGRVTYPAIDDPAIDDPAIDDPAIDDPAIDDPAIDDPAIDDPAIDDPAIDDASFEVPAIDDPAIDDPAIDDAAISAASLLDEETYDPDHEGQPFRQITWKMSMNGNSTTSVTAKVFASAPPEVLAHLSRNSQLLVSRRYRTVSNTGCQPVLVNASQVVANIINPQLDSDGDTADVDVVNPPNEQPSFVMTPGSSVFVTLRIYDQSINPAAFGMAARAQPGDEISEEDVDAVMDISAPTLVLPGEPPDFTFRAEAEDEEGAIVEYTVSAQDDVDGSVAVTCSPDSGTLFPLGATSVGCSATDASGNRAEGTFTVLVEDTTAPVVTPPSSVVAEATSASGAVVAFSPGTATDSVSGPLTPLCQPASGTTFPLGTTSVTCTATDGSGNAASAFFDVVVRDTTAPVVTPPANVIAEAMSAAGALVTFSPGTATDAVSGTLTPACLPASGSVFPLGTTTVTCTAEDASGNRSSATFAVAVVDTTPPTLTLPENQSVVGSSPAGGVVNFTATALDLVDGSTPIGCTPASGSVFLLGQTTVACSSSDSRGNVANGSFTVSVQLGFLGLLSSYAPPPTTFKIGSSIPIVWKYANASGVAVSSPSMRPKVVIKGPQGMTLEFIEDSGSSGLRYDASGLEWQLNWQTKGLKAGLYSIEIHGQATGQINGPFPIQLKK